MSNGDYRFTNNETGETLVHWERGGTRNLKIVDTGVQSQRGFHAVLDQSGNPRYIREKDGRVICNDRLP